MDPDRILPDRKLSIRQGAIRASGWSYADGGTIAQMYYEGLAAHYGFSLDTPVQDLPKKAVDVILYGTNGEKIKMTRKMEYGSRGIFHRFRRGAEQSPTAVPGNLQRMDAGGARGIHE